MWAAEHRVTTALRFPSLSLFRGSTRPSRAPEPHRVATGAAAGEVSFGFGRLIGHTNGWCDQ